MKKNKILPLIVALSMVTSVVPYIPAGATDGPQEIDFIGTSGTPETFDGYTGEGWESEIGSFSATGVVNNQFGLETITEIAKPEVGATVTATTYPTYVSGATLTAQKRGGGSANTTYELDAPVASGNVYFKSDIGISNNKNAFDASSIALVSTDGTEVVSIPLNGAAAQDLNLKGTETKSVGKINPRTAANITMGFNVDMVVDLDENTATCKFDFINSDLTRTQGEATVNIADKDIAKLVVKVGSRSSTNNALKLDNTQLYAMTVASDTPYTVYYKTADGTVVNTIESKGATGADPVFSKEAFMVENVRYFYVSDDSEGKTINADGTTEVNVTVREAVSTKATVTAKSGEDILDVVAANVDLYEGSTTKVNYPKYIVKDSKLYNIAVGAAATGYYATDITGTQEDQNINLSYTEVADTTPVYFSEAEDIGEDSQVSNSAVRCSSGKAYNVSTEGVVIGKLSAGTYKIEGAAWGGTNKTDGVNDTYTVTAGEKEVYSVVTKGSHNVTTGGEFTLTEDAEVKIVGTGLATTTGLDYILITGTGSFIEVATEYNVTVAPTTNGTVTTDVTKAAEGDIVTITATPAEGYELEAITVKDADEADVTVADGKFTMPAKAVTVTATFKVKTPEPTTAPTTEPTTAPTTEPTTAPTTEPTTAPTTEPTTAPTTEPTTAPTTEPTTAPTTEPTTAPTTEPTTAPTTEPTTAPTTEPTTAPTTEPTTAPTTEPTTAPTATPDPTAVIDFTNRSLTYATKGSTTVFDVTDAASDKAELNAKALAAAGAGKVLKLGSSQNGATKMLGYKAEFAKDGDNTVVYGGQVTMSFKLEPMQVRDDKDASIELSFADIKGNAILPITVGTGSSAYLKVNDQSANNIAYGNYYVVTYTLDFTTKKATVKIDAKDGTNCLTVENVDISAENITQLYRADSDWKYGYLALDDIKLEATEIGIPVFYSVTINTERYAKLTTADGSKYFADINGKVEIPLQKPNTTFDYTISKVGYTDVTGTVPALTADFTDTKPMTKSDEDIIFIESEFGNENEAYVSMGGSRNDSISLGAVELPNVSEVVVDFDFAGFGGQGGQQKTWFINTDAKELVGIQISDNGMYAWTGWTGAENHNQSSDIGAYTNGVRIGDVPSGAFTVNFVIDKVNKAITVSYNNTTNSLTYSVDATTITGLGAGLYRYNGELKTTEFKIVTPDPTFMQLAGDTQFAKIQGKTVTRAFTRTETIITPDETFTWTLSRADEKAMTGITVADGVVSVTDEAIPGTVTLTATGTTGKTASIDIKVEDYSEIKFTADGPQSYDITDTTGTYKITSAVDAYGDEVMDMLPAVAWSSSDSTVVTIDPATGVASVVGKGTAVITATVTNGTAITTVTIPVTVAKYSVTADATGESTVVDIADLVNDNAITGYQITTSKDGVLVNQYEIAKNEAITYGAAEAAEKIVAKIVDGKLAITVTPVEAGAAVDMTAADGEGVFLWNSLNGMSPVEVIKNTKITVDTTGADKVEVAPVYETKIGTLMTVPADTYNVTITANNGKRTDVYVNDQMMFNNVNQGSDKWTVGRIIADSAEYTASDVVIADGYAKFNLRDDQSAGTTITNVKFVKAPSNVKRAKRIYLIGDSLVANYYGTAPEGKEGLVRTGWGQVFDKYVADGVEVTNLGNSGAHAEGMLSDAFTNVVASAQEGDIVVWESGYNDRSYSTVDRMKAAITTAINACNEKGIDIYLVTPNASSHDYNDSVVWSSNIRDLGTETSTPVIDLAAKSYKFLSDKYGTDAHTILRAIYNNTEDTLHSSYNAANCWASIVAQGLYDAGKEAYINTEASYTFNDGTNDITVKVQAKDVSIPETPAE